MKTVVKHMILGVLTLSMGLGHMNASALDIWGSMRSVAYSVYSTISEYPKATAGAVASVIGVASLYAYFKSNIKASLDLNLKTGEVKDTPSLKEIAAQDPENVADVALEGVEDLQRDPFVEQRAQSNGLADIVSADASKGGIFDASPWRAKFHDKVVLKAGYWFFLFGEGTRNRASYEYQFPDRDQLVQNYKIHLMPETEDVDTIIQKIIDRFKVDQKFKQSMCAFKVKDRIDTLQQERTGQIMPKIVIYPASGKENAQYVLDIIRYMFADVEGIDVCPRYNQQVNSLIYFAQGDGDFKDSERCSQYYEQPNRVYYKSDFTDAGANNGYHLDYTKDISDVSRSMIDLSPVLFNNNADESVDIDGNDEWNLIRHKIDLEIPDENYSFTRKLVRPSLENEGVITLLCVHGTFSTTNKFTGDLAKENSQHLVDFARKLAENKNKSVEVIAFSWSGLLNNIVRRDAGKVLAHMLVENMHSASEEIWVYAHSHGCNVASLAAQAYHEQTEKMFDTAIYCASPTSDIEPTDQFDIAQGIYCINDVYHFYGSSDVTQALGSFHSKWNWDRKLPGVHNIRLMHETHDLDHANIKSHVSKNLWDLLKVIKDNYPLHYDLDAAVTDNPDTLYVALRHSDRRHPDCDQDMIQRAEQKSSEDEIAFQQAYGRSLRINLHDTNPWTAFIQMAMNEYSSRKNEK